MIVNTFVVQKQHSNSLGISSIFSNFLPSFFSSSYKRSHTQFPVLLFVSKHTALGSEAIEAFRTGIALRHPLIHLFILLFSLFSVVVPPSLCTTFLVHLRRSPKRGDESIASRASRNIKTKREKRGNVRSRGARKREHEAEDRTTGRSQNGKDIPVYPARVRKPN